MNEFEIYQANKKIINRIINEVRQCFFFFKKQKMEACWLYVILSVQNLLRELEEHNNKS